MAPGRWRHGSGSLLGELGERLGVDVGALLCERAELMGLPAATAVSAGGATRLLRSADGWIAVSLARPDDWELLPAWLGVEGGWDVVEGAVADREGVALVEVGALLGLPVARLGERVEPPMPLVGSAIRLEGLRVVDLSTLWAGPLAGRLLAGLGADVVKVESSTRPDGARRGNAEFFERLNGAKRSVIVDFDTERHELHRLVAGADVVITSARARALDQLGLAPTGQAWLAITGHGLDTHRVAFGDDAAVAGGLVEWVGGEPQFVGDAIADPLTGITGAAAVLDALADGRTGFIDLSLAGVAASFAAWFAEEPA